MAISITWNDIENSMHTTLSDGDKIQYDESVSADPNYFELVLRLGQGITWWKAVTLENNKCWPGRVEAQDDSSGPVAFQVPNSELDGDINLLLGKAKAFGVKVTDMYKITNAVDKKGKHIVLTWVQDK
jgi:hypothetical protein